MSISKFSSCVRHVVVVTLAAVGLVSSASHAVGQSPCCDSEIGCEGLVGCDSFVEAGCDSCCGELSCREQWAESGITFSNNFTQFYFGTVAGGRDQVGRYGGHGDYVANFDFGKLGIQEGLFLKVRAEHRFGQSISRDTGALLPATIAAELPVVESNDLYITNFVITQALSERFIVFAGKVDSLDGDVNAFAHGRGIRQFSNLAFVANPVALRTIPYSTLGAGFSYLMNGQPLFSFLVVNPTDTARSTGFGELFAEGVAMSSELRLPTNFMSRPGHMLFGATYSTRDYVSLGQDPRIILPQVPIDRSSDSWSLYYNSDHYLCVDPCDSSRGWGYFSRAGIADDQANPVSYFWSLGLGGSSFVPGRTNDTFGVGYYTSETSSKIGPLLSAALGAVGDGHGVEAFYSVQATKTLTVTPDFQWISQAQQSLDDAYVLGVRANIAF